MPSITSLSLGENKEAVIFFIDSSIKQLFGKSELKSHKIADSAEPEIKVAPLLENVRVVTSVR